MSDRTEQQQYDEWYDMQIEAWAERQNETNLYHTDDYPTYPTYSFPSTEETEVETIEDVIYNWYYQSDIHNCPF